MERDGVSLRYELRPGDGAPLVLVHEMGGTIESWDLVLPLLRRDTAVLRYDTRGAGLSTKIRGTARIEDMAADIAAVIDAAGLEGPVVIAGTAVGGALALHFAARHPGRVAGLVAFGPAAGVEEERKPGMLARADAVERDGMISLVEASFALSYPEHLRGDRHRFEQFRGRWLANDPASYAAIMRMLVGFDMAEDLAAISCPTLVLAGTDDLVRPPKTVRPVADRIPGARFATLASGHFAATQTPGLVAEALDGFIATLGSLRP